MKQSGSVFILIALFALGILINGLVTMQPEEDPVANVAHLQLLDYQQGTN